MKTIKTSYICKAGELHMKVVRQQGESEERMITRFNTIIRSSGLLNEIKLVGMTKKDREKAILQIKRGNKI